MHVPEDWKKTKLAEKLAVLKDGTHFSPQSKSGSFMYLTSKNIRFGKLDLDNVSYITEEEHQKIYKGSPVKYGDVLLTKDGANTGNAAINSLDFEFSLLSSVAFLRGKSGILLNNYLLHLLLSPIGQAIIKSEMAGQAITRLTLQKIGSPGQYSGSVVSG
jgi:type I restriction enzyme S subunit